VNSSSTNGFHKYYLFTDVEYKFKQGEHGTFSYARLSEGVVSGQPSKTLIIQNFRIGKLEIICQWASFYHSLPPSTGLFVFIEKAPVTNKRFAILNWSELAPFVTQTFLLFLAKNIIAHGLKLVEIPLLIGYKIPEANIHWQCSVLRSDISPVSISKLGGEYFASLNNLPISWTYTRNASYEYFFGRGKLHDIFTTGRILIIGVGAIGSMVAMTLTRGGCKNLWLADYDYKEPENVCRSEYSFVTGVIDKVVDLRKQLIFISPFISVSISTLLSDFAKHSAQSSEDKVRLQEVFQEFDVIFDCSTDNDLAYLMQDLNISAKIFVLSITNHAKELVCVTQPNGYDWLMHIFNQLGNDEVDLYNPTGCWSPTFKASYNDISLLVQSAIKYINNQFVHTNPVRNFHLSSAEVAGEIKLNQF
jgi:hypothetical protein